MIRTFIPIFSLAVFCTSLGAEEKVVRVFVALCDNANQGIAKVNARIGDGDKPADNLYWGCSDGLSRYFQKSAKWKLLKSEKAVSESILERLTFQHRAFGEVTLVAEAYRGSEMKVCLADFFAAVADADTTDTKLVAFIGHNGLMDRPDTKTPEGIGKKDVVVLSCLSDSWFAGRLDHLGANRILMTRSLMYPGAFILHDALEGWLRDESKAKIRDRAARAYAGNQKISVKSGRSIFADLE
ncbi:MAG: hypothetical protein P1U89_24670 [Verrucomicrobiales bacterium]|nr:hypothetical protein [Verrucomicrobiales bacterium]